MTLLEKLKQQQDIQDIIVANNMIIDVGAELLARALQGRRFVKLDVSDNHISTNGMRALLTVCSNQPECTVLF